MKPAFSIECMICEEYCFTAERRIEIVSTRFASIQLQVFICQKVKTIRSRFVKGTAEKLVSIDYSEFLPGD
jgi:hypothetical protein